MRDLSNGGVSKEDIKTLEIIIKDIDKNADIESAHTFISQHIDPDKIYLGRNEQKAFELKLMKAVE